MNAEVLYSMCVHMKCGVNPQLWQHQIIGFPPVTVATKHVTVTASVIVKKVKNDIRFEVLMLANGLICRKSGLVFQDVSSSSSLSDIQTYLHCCGDPGEN